MVMDKLHTIVVGNKPQEGLIPADDPHAMQIRADDKEAGKIGMNEVPMLDKSDVKPSEDAQSGVKKIEAVTISWSRGSMFTVLILYASSPIVLTKQTLVGYEANGIESGSSPSSTTCAPPSSLVSSPTPQAPSKATHS
ncbi:hypothetical protein EIK77_002046 [Talaromyces pinophilus]|nr:hypothetical protein EIK77_002046 [Talaromyces pinophilus]